jgi:hypothetical protein
MDEVAARAIGAAACDAEGPARLCLVLGRPHNRPQLQMAMRKLAADAVAAAASV